MARRKAEGTERGDLSREEGAAGDGRTERRGFMRGAPICAHPRRGPRWRNHPMFDARKVLLGRGVAPQLGGLRSTSDSPRLLTCGQKAAQERGSTPSSACTPPETCRQEAAQYAGSSAARGEAGKMRGAKMWKASRGGPRPGASFRAQEAK